MQYEKQFSSFSLSHDEPLAFLQFSVSPVKNTIKVKTTHNYGNESEKRNKDETKTEAKTKTVRYKGIAVKAK